MAESCKTKTPSGSICGNWLVKCPKCGHTGCSSNFCDNALGTKTGHCKKCKNFTSNRPKL